MLALNPASPHQWWKQVRAIERQRASRDAPVDFLGCHTLGERDDGEVNFRFQTLLALVLSPRTTDERVAHAMQRLRLLTSCYEPDKDDCEILEKPGNYLSAATVASLDAETLQVAISGVTFAKSKAPRVTQLARTLHDDYGGDVPRTLAELMALPGVGPKVAHLALQIAWCETQGISVDTHVHRIAGRLGWTRGARDAEATRKQLESWLPREHWQGLNPLLVGFGQQVCAERPNCRGCLLSAERLCPQVGLEREYQR